MEPLFNAAKIQFTLNDEIGYEGKSSNVYIATDHQFEDELVIKRIAKEDVSDIDEYFKEAKILYATQHQFVAPIHYGCQDDEFIYIAMPLYRNGSLKRRLTDYSLSVREILRYSSHILNGLHHIHSKGLLHLDLKPDNILINDRDEAIITDFGQSVYLNDDGFGKTGYLYYKYFTPEELRDEHASVQSDIYQFGLTLYQAVNGIDHFNQQVPEDPFELQDLTEAGAFPDREDYKYHVPANLRRVINRCLNLEQVERYSSVLALQNELNSVDGNIDWVFEEDGDTLTWAQSLEDEKERIVVVKLNENKKFEMDCFRRNLATNKERRCKGHCVAEENTSTIKSIVQKALRNNW